MRLNLNKFTQEEKGSVIIIAVFLFVVVFGILSLTIDLNKTQTGFSKLQNSADSTVLDAADWISKARRKSSDSATHTSSPKWLPSQAELLAHVREGLATKFNSDQASARIVDNSIETSATNYALYTDVTLKACASIGADISKVRGDDSNKKVCVESAARIYPGGISDKEIVIAYDLNAATTEMPLKSALLGGDFDPTNPIPLNHVYGASGILPTYLQSEALMKQNNLYVGVVPYTKFVNLYPFGKDFINDYQTSKPAVRYNYSGSGLGSRPSITVSGNPSDLQILRDLTEDYPVFDDAGFNSLLTNPTNYKFESAYTYMRYDEDPVSHKRGIFYQKHPELDTDQKLQPWTNGNTLQAYYPDPSMADNGHHPEVYLGPYGDQTSWMFRSYDFMAPRRAVVDLYENNMVQPLTTSYEAVKSALLMNHNLTAGAYFEQAYGGTTMPDGSKKSPLVPEFKSYVDSSFPTDFVTKYFNTDLVVIGNSSRSNGFVGLMTGWTMLSDSFKGKWNKSSVYEDVAGTTTDRSSLPSDKTESKRDKILILLINGHTDDPGTGSMDIVADNYVEYPTAISYGYTYGGDELLGKTMFDIIGYYSNYYESKYRQFKTASSASYDKLCNKIKADGIELYVVNYSACYTDDKSNCNYGFAGKALETCAGADHYIPGNSGTLNEDIEGVFGGLSTSDRVTLIK